MPTQLKPMFGTQLKPMFGKVAETGVGIEYWLRWQVGVCALIILGFFIGAYVILMRRKRDDDDDGYELRKSDLWVPCWRDLNPIWVLVYRVFALVIMTWILYQMVLRVGILAFYFYTIWTFALLLVYFVVGAIISAQGCMMYLKPASEVGEKENFLKNKEGMDGLQKYDYSDEANDKAGYLGNVMHIMYMTCAGAILMTDIVFWCVLVPMFAGVTFQLTPLMISIHSLNLVLLLGDSALNRLPFRWFGLVYFFFWGAIYIAFQWIIHACGIKWWPYPFLDLANPRAPLWYLGLTLFHVPCYGIYVLILKGKASMFTRLFPSTFVRTDRQILREKAA